MTFYNQVYADGTTLTAGARLIRMLFTTITHFLHNHYRCFIDDNYNIANKNVHHTKKVANCTVINFLVMEIPETVTVFGKTKFYLAFFRPSVLFSLQTLHRPLLSLTGQ